MAPIIQETHNGIEDDAIFDHGRYLAHPKPGDEVVISGIAGYFPNSDSVLEFGENLCSKKLLTSDDDRRWKHCHPEIPHVSGKVNVINKFDSAFFGVHHKQAIYMDPMNRMLMERVYEAIFDAGVNPKELHGSSTGVFVGTCISETELFMTTTGQSLNSPFTLVGCARTMQPNRISYWLGCTGPSYAVDTACSSSTYALNHAFQAIRNGQCEAAIVAGTNLCMHPHITLNFAKLGILSPDSKCKCFDQDANGYVRAEAIVAVFLQKAKDSRRIYAQVGHVKTNCDGYKPEGITFPGKESQKNLIKEVYFEAGVNPHDIEYLEAHCTGTKVGDPQELAAVDEVFCQDRNRPLKIGSVKSNMGHSEPSSGLCSVAKMVYAYASGVIPPNVNYNRPREEVDGLMKGRMIVITEPLPWNRGMIGINSFGFGGANAHVMLRGMAKRKINNAAPLDDLPRLVMVSGRTEFAISKILDHLDSKPVDVEFIKLIHCIHEEEISGHIYRGFILLDAKAVDNVGITRSVEYYTGAKRPIWFVFSGMGSQWSSMGAQLMRIPIFSAAIQRCHEVLKPRGINITDIITKGDPKMFDNILHSFVGIAAVQIGLCDILKAMGIEPEYIIGHSVGELGCAYADGCFTTEEMVLSAYSRGLASIETPFIKGSMAAIGMGYKQLKDVLPPEIEIACHNSSTSCTISGPAEAMKKYVATLTSKGIFAKEVECSNIAYHSRYISKAGPKLLEYLETLVPNPKKRSSRWVSTSVPQLEWDQPKAQYSSAEYHTNNLLNPVLFEEASRLIPNNAITIEIAPHGLLQAILKRSLAASCINIPLTKKDHPDNVAFMLTSLGKLFESGLNPKIAVLYPNVPLPVSIETPMLSHLVEWEHSDDYFVPTYQRVEKLLSSERRCFVDVGDDSHDYLNGHVIDGRTLYPATGYLVLVWETLAQMHGLLYQEQSVVFEDVRFRRATTMHKGGSVDFHIMIHKGTGQFEIAESGTSVVTGRISVLPSTDTSSLSLDLKEPPKDGSTDYVSYSSKDFYKELRLRGYNYSGQFRGMELCDITGTRGVVTFSHNWTTFMDTMMQIKLLSLDTRSLFIPTRINKLIIDVETHYSLMDLKSSRSASLPVTVYPEHDIIRCGGVEVHGLHATSIARRQPTGIPVLEKYQFIPHFGKKPMMVDEAIRFNLQLMLENLQSLKVKTVEIMDADSLERKLTPLSPIIRDNLEDVPLLQPESTVLSGATLDLGPGITIEDKNLPNDGSVFLVVGAKLLEKTEVLRNAFNTLKDGAFVLTRESLNVIVGNYKNYHIITITAVGDEKLVLLRKKQDPKPTKFIVVKSADAQFEWINNVKAEIAQAKKLVLVSEKETLNGIKGLVNCLRREPGGEIVKCLLIDDKAAPDFNSDLPLYESQLEKDLSFNIFRDGEWGSYHHMALKDLVNVPVDHAFAKPLVRGDLGSVAWVEGPIKLNNSLSEPGTQPIQIYYSALNFRDIMSASGRVPVEAFCPDRIKQDCIQGLEFSGRTLSGDRVMGLMMGGGVANVINANNLFLWKVPDNWSLEDAATVPVAYGTAYYALLLMGSMKGGEKVLIHAGSGGVGQAAIRVCLNHGCTVFTTVGTQEKRDFIKKLFPQLQDQHIGNSRNTSFREMVLKETNGKGVDIILNSLSEDKLQASIECLGAQGRFLEIGKFDIANNSKIGMSFLMKEASIKGIMMDSDFFMSKEMGTKLGRMLTEGVKSGAIQPLTRTIFSQEEVGSSYRFMAAGKHIGKVLIKIRDEEKVRIVIPKPIKISAVPRYMCDPEASYIIVGGMGGFGLELADWLILRGCKKLVLISRRGITNGYQSSRIRLWRSYNLAVEVYTDNVTTEPGTVSILTKARKLGPVKAIFNLAVVLKDAIFENQTPETFATSFNPKVDATRHLDLISRKLCPQLSDFVVFSSVSCGRGNAGQTNYGMANSIMERICEERKKIGLPALAIQWGAVGDVGLVADMQEEHIELEIGGTLQQRITSCLQVMDRFLRQDAPVVSSIVVAEKRFGCSGGTPVDVVAHIMGVKDLKKISSHVTLAELGMDSMMALEINQILEREFEIFLTAQEMRTLSFARLHELTAEREQNISTASGTMKASDTNVMRMFIGMIGNEDIASMPIVHMNTMIGTHTDEDIILEKGQIVYMIPGVEGIATALEPLCKRLRFNTSVLQLGYEFLDKTIHSITERILTVLRPRIFHNVPFTILGYSMGSLIALEVMSELEKEGFIGTVFCLDGGSDYLKAMLQAAGCSDENQIQNEILSYVHDIVLPKSGHDIHAIMSLCKSYEEKLDKIINLIPDEMSRQMKYSLQHKKDYANAVYNRMRAIKEYDVLNFRKVKSEVILLRIKDSLYDMVSENYGLDKFCEQPVKVHLLEGDHLTIRENKECANIINRTLQKQKEMELAKKLGPQDFTSMIKQTANMKIQ